MAAAAIQESYTEAPVQKRLEVLFDGGHERCPAGIVDIVSRRFGLFIEIKRIDHYSDGFGQLEKYSSYFKDLQPVLYLFGKKEHMQSARWDEIERGCHRHGIVLMRDDVDYQILRDQKERENVMNIEDLPEARRIVQEAETKEGFHFYQGQLAMNQKQMKTFYRYMEKIRSLATDLAQSDLAICFGIARLNDSLIGLVEGLEEMYGKNETMEDIAAKFIASEIRLEKDAKTPLFDYNEVRTMWHDTHGYRITASALRKATWALLSTKGCTRIKNPGGSLIIGIVLKNPINHEPQGKKPPSASVSAAFVAVPVAAPDMTAS